MQMQDNRIFTMSTHFSNCVAEILMNHGYWRGSLTLADNINSFNGGIPALQNQCIFGIRNNGFSRPHFYLIIENHSIAFDIATGQRLENVYGYEIFDELVRVYWELDRLHILAQWNKVRHEQYPAPSDWADYSTTVGGVAMGVTYLKSAYLPQSILRNRHDRLCA